jgi:branched-subunit amino acid ABC-type transport system permease component
LVVGAVFWGIAKSKGRRAVGAMATAVAGVVGLLIAGLGLIAAREGWDLGRYRMVVFALALILMMLVRPQGLLGVRELWERQLWRGVWRSFAGEVPRRKGGAS